MAEMTIRLEINPVTKKRDLIIKLDSDPDALPQEHEQQHRALVEKLIQGGMLKASELGQIRVERETAAPTAEQEPAREETERRTQAEGQG